MGFGNASVEEKDYRREIVPIVSTISFCISGFGSCSVTEFFLLIEVDS